MHCPALPQKIGLLGYRTSSNLLEHSWNAGATQIHPNPPKSAILFYGRKERIRISAPLSYMKDILIYIYLHIYMSVLYVEINININRTKEFLQEHRIHVGWSTDFCMYIIVHIAYHIYIYISNTPDCKYVFIYMYIHVNGNVHTWKCMHTCKHNHVFIWIHIHVQCVYIYMYVYLSGCKCV